MYNGCGFKLYDIYSQGNDYPQGCYRIDDKPEPKPVPPKPAFDPLLKPDGITIYKTVEINGVKWLAENYINIPSVGETYTPTKDGEVADNLGLLYDVNAILSLRQSLKGTGWHIPTMFEWESLMRYACETYPTCKDLANNEYESVLTTCSEKNETFVKLAGSGKPANKISPALGAMLALTKDAKTGEAVVTTDFCSTADKLGLSLQLGGRYEPDEAKATNAKRQAYYWASDNLDHVSGNDDAAATYKLYAQWIDGFYAYGRAGKPYYCAIRLIEGEEPDDSTQRHPIPEE